MIYRLFKVVPMLQSPLSCTKADPYVDLEARLSNNALRCARAFWGFDLDGAAACKTNDRVHLVTSDWWRGLSPRVETRIVVSSVCTAAVEDYRLISENIKYTRSDRGVCVVRPRKRNAPLKISPTFPSTLRLTTTNRTTRRLVVLLLRLPLRDAHLLAENGGYL